jgi:hypothetical protein
VPAITTLCPFSLKWLAIAKAGKICPPVPPAAIIIE